MGFDLDNYLDNYWSNTYDSYQDFSVSWSGPLPLIMCMTTANISGDLSLNIPYIWMNGFTLSPSKNYDISLSMVTYTYGSDSWVSFEPGRPIDHLLSVISLTSRAKR